MNTSRYAYMMSTLAALLAGPLFHSVAPAVLAAETDDAGQTAQIDKGLAAYNRGDYTTALKLWRPLAEQGVPRAQNNLGVLYDEGHGVAQDASEAVKWYRKAAWHGHVKAQYNLGLKYAGGQGVQADRTVALRWFRRAAEEGHADAQNRLGWELAYGEKGPRDHVQAVDWFRQAAGQGNAAACFNLGLAYENGRGVPQDMALAHYWYDQAAAKYTPGQWRQNAVKARQRVDAHLRGKDRKTDAQFTRADQKQFDRAAAANSRGDFSTAFKLWRQLAERGHATSQYNTGVLYIKGRGVEKDDFKGAEWYLKAANQGLAVAQYYFAARIEIGMGVDQDLQRAKIWFDQAAKSYPAGEDRQKAIAASRETAQHMRDRTVPGLRLARTMTTSGNGDRINVFPTGANKKLAEGDYQLALLGYNQAIHEMENGKQTFKTNSMLADAYIGRIKSLVGLGQLERADQELLRLLRANTIYVFSHAKMQIDAMNRLLAEDPRNLEYLEFRSNAYFHDSQYDKARDDATLRIKYATSDEERAEAYSDRSYYQALLKEPRKAMEDINQAIKLHPVSDHYANRAYRHRSAENYSKAIEDFTKALSLGSETADRHRLNLKDRAEAYELVEDFEHAIQDCNAALELTPESHWDRAKIQFKRASLHYRAGQLAAAKKDLDALIEKKPKDKAYLALRSEVLMAMRRDDLAKKDIAVLTEINAKYTSETLKPKIDKLLEERKAEDDAKPLDRAVAKQAWDLGASMALSTLEKMVGRNPEQYKQKRAMAEQTAAGLGVELQPLPDKEENFEKNFKAALGYINDVRNDTGRQLLIKHGARVAHVFRLTANIGVLASTYQLNIKDLRAKLAEACVADAEKSGLPEDLWRPLADKVAADATRREFQKALQIMESGTKKYFAAEPS